MADATTADTASAGRPARLEYQLVLPPGWEGVPLDDLVDQRAKDLAARAALSAAPGVRDQVRLHFQRQLQAAFREARAAGTQDLYLPTEPVQGVPLGMSIAVTAAGLPDGAGGSISEALLSFAEGDPTAAAATVGTLLAIRRVSDVPPQFDETGDLVVPASRRITYLTLPPNDSRMMAITGSILKLELDDGGALAEAMEFLFDALVRTVRFDSVGVAS